MRKRRLGRSGFEVSQIAFGCGGTAGLMVRGSHKEQCDVVNEALERGINIFDTSPTYGAGHSETNLGTVLKTLDATPLIGTKIDIGAGGFEDLEGWIRRSVQRSQERLGRERLDILYLHNRVGHRRDLAGRVLSVEDVLGAGGVADIMTGLKRKGVVGAIGFTGLGHTDSVIKVLEADRFDLFQAYYNLINPSAIMPTVAAWRAQDYGEMIPMATQRDVGVVGIRVLAAGALSESDELHKFAKSYSSLSRAEVDADRVKAKAFRSLAPEGASLASFALRFALSEPAIDTLLVGISESSHLREALAAADAGPLELERLQSVAARFRELYEMA
jgi:aryl-alcohol dehydrogenase-like predicted oxidoreductase